MAMAMTATIPPARPANWLLANWFGISVTTTPRSGAPAGAFAHGRPRSGPRGGCLPAQRKPRSARPGRRLVQCPLRSEMVGPAAGPGVAPWPSPPARAARPPRARRPPPPRGRRRRATAHSTTSSTSQTSGTLVPQTPTGTEFLSPSKNISCEIDYNFGPSAITSTLCLTISPPKSVTLGPTAALTECTGVDCLSNAGTNTPTLAYGMSITLGALHLRLVDGGHQVHAGEWRRLPHLEQRHHRTGERQGGRRLELSPGLLPEGGLQLCCGSLEVSRSSRRCCESSGPTPR